ncbi:MAG: hypothetical protein PVSMB1_15500 [Gemmatimonadaceae bacterium]
MPVVHIHHRFGRRRGASHRRPDQLRSRREGPDGQQFPLAHVFTRRGKKIHHTWSSELFFAKPDPGQDMRHVDFMWPIWSILDLTPEGRGSWYPRLAYP